MKSLRLAVCLCLVGLCMSQLPINDELDSFVRQVEFSISDLEEQDAVEAVMDSYMDLVYEYNEDTARLEQDLVGKIQDSYGDSSEAVTSFTVFIKELRRQVQVKPE